MIKTLLFLLENTSYRSEETDILRGINKLPENWSEIKNYIKLKIKQNG